jgi:hypothetical protein
MQFGDSGRNAVRGPHFTNSDVYITKSFSIREGITLRIDAQMFNAFNHPNFALPSDVEAGYRINSTWIFRLASARWRAPSRRLPACWALIWVAIALRG